MFVFHSLQRNYVIYKIVLGIKNVERKFSLYQIKIQFKHNNKFKKLNPEIVKTMLMNLDFSYILQLL